MKVGTLVRYIGDWHYTIDKGNRLGIVIVANAITGRLHRRRVLFNGNFETIDHIDKLDVVNES
jgi:hypothetical protein